ncbi:MAG: hypothetical protein U0746_18850 [Gemmataceae bacterium]
MTKQLPTSNGRATTLDRRMLHVLREALPPEAYANFLYKLDRLIAAYFDPTSMPDPKATPVDPIRLDGLRAHMLERSGTAT